MPSVSDVSVAALLATTKPKISRMFYNSAVDRIPLLNAIKKAGNMLEVQDGGRAFHEAAISGDSDAVGVYEGLDTLNVNEQKGIQAFIYNPAFMYGSILIDNPTLAMNAGSEAVLKILEGRMEQARTSVNNLLDKNLCGAYGTVYGAKASKWIGIQDIVSDTNTATIPETGIDRSLAENIKLRNQVDATSVATATAWNTSNAGRILMTGLYHAASFDMDRPKLCLMTRSIFDAYSISLQANERFVGIQETAGGGFPTLKFMANCDVAYGDNVKAGHFYFINPDKLIFKILSKKNFEMSDFLPAYNQDAQRAFLTVGGQLTTGAPKYHGVATNIGF